MLLPLHYLMIYFVTQLKSKYIFLENDGKIAMLTEKLFNFRVVVSANCSEPEEMLIFDDLKYCKQ